MKARLVVLVTALAAVTALASCVKEWENPCEGTDEMCGATCTDLSTDESNCGTCGHSCSTGQTCSGGSCTNTPCLSHQTDCEGICVDLSSDHDNCGTCGHACLEDQVCSGGECAAGCEEGLTNCDGSCVDLTSDPDHCGNCITQCPEGEGCVDGLCDGSTSCSSPFTDCYGECVDLSSDAHHCGSCDQACRADQECADGFCVCPVSYGECEGECRYDHDGDGVGDDCDMCPVDNPDDTDGDGVCESVDQCPGIQDADWAMILNPGFTTGDAWVLTSGALINTTSPGNLDPGEGYLMANTICAGGTLAQQVCMPGTWGTLGAMTLLVYPRQDSCGDPMYCQGRAGVRFNGHFQQIDDYLAYGYDPAPHILCLGEAAYGGIVELALAGEGATSSGTCNPMSTPAYAFDNLAFDSVPPMTCPGPGTVLNGDFGAGATGWTLSTDASIMSGTATLVGRAATCGSSFMYGSFSQPLSSSMPHAALVFSQQGTSGWTFNVTVKGGSSIKSEIFTGTGAWTTTTICLDPANEGVVQTLELHNPFPGGLCSSSPYRYVTIDNLTLVSDAALCD